MSKNIHITNGKDPLEYVKSVGERPEYFECTECEWRGTDAEKVEKVIDEAIQMKELQCPECGNPDFYGLVKPKNDGTK